MKIVIVGDGKVGYALTQLLSAEGHDVTVIDSNPEVLQQSLEALDVLVVTGNGASLEIQEQADVAHSDLLIAATSADEINLLCCILAKKLGCRSTIARVRNPDYMQQVRFLKNELGLSMTVNPESSAARAIFRILQFPSFLKIDSFARGRVELVELRIREDSPLSGLRIDRISDTIKARVLVCAVDRSGSVTIPSGSFVLQTNDKITVTAATNDLAKLIKNLDIASQKVHHVIIIGGSRIAEYLADALLESRADVKIIEQDPDRCLALSERLPKALIINGNGASQEILEAEHIASADAVVTLTGMDEENLIISMYAEHMGVPKTVTKINRTEFGVLFKDSSAGSIISPKQLTANEILRFVRAMDNSADGSMITLHKLVDGKAEALEFSVEESAPYLGIPLSRLSLKKNVLIACITRKGAVIFPDGNEVISAGDSVIVVATAGAIIRELGDIFLSAE